MSRDENNSPKFTVSLSNLVIFLCGMVVVIVLFPYFLMHKKQGQLRSWDRQRKMLP